MSGPRRDRPFLRLAVSAADVADDQRLQKALTEIAGQKHPSVIINTRPKDGMYNLEGRAESDLDLICDRLRDYYRIAINVAPPQAILIETILKQAEGEGKYIRQTGGSGNYGHCKLRIEPAESGAGYEFINDIKGGVVPKEYIRPIDQGIQGAMELGILAGFPVVDIRVSLFDGSYHEADSNEMAFKFAGSIAFKEAAMKARPALLEPMMAIEIEVPEDLATATEHEVYAHRGRIESNVTANGFSEIRAVVPLSELLVSSSGIAVWPMEFAGYEVVRDSGSSDENGAGVTANKPAGPRLGRRSEMARPNREDE